VGQKHGGGTEAWRVRSGSDLEARGEFGCHMDGKRFYIPIMDQFWRNSRPVGHDSVMAVGACARGLVWFSPLVPGWSR
jgi:hypothetical protein